MAPVILRAIIETAILAVHLTFFHQQAFFHDASFTKASCYANNAVLRLPIEADLQQPLYTSG